MQCATHPNVETELACGKCDKPICPRCLVYTPVGTRCRECANLRKLPQYDISALFLLRAAGAALVAGAGLGVVWGFLFGITGGYFLLIAGFAVGYGVGEAISLALSNLKLRDTLRQQSIRDPLTGLYNRRFLEEYLVHEGVRATRKNRPLSVIMLDIDNFKRFNDTFGHDAGDAILRRMGLLLQGHVRESDIACRIGGEEFALLLPEAPLSIAFQRAENILETVRRMQVKHGGQVLGAITVSLGVAAFPKHGETPEALIRAADRALYQAKEGGRNKLASA